MRQIAWIIVVLLFFQVSSVYGLDEGAKDPWAARRAKLDERPKKFFAHYMGCFPIGAQAISPGYSRSKFHHIRHDSGNFELAFGGRRRGEPLLPDSVDGLPLEESADLEVRRAMRAGIDGFAFMAIAGGKNNVFPVMDAMFKVCEENDYPFEITWALSGLDRSIEAIDYILKKHGKSPKLARRDGKVLMLGYQSVFSGIDGALRIYKERYPDLKVDWKNPDFRLSREGLGLLREGFRDLEKRFDTPMYFQFGFGALGYGIHGKPKEALSWPEMIGILAEGFEAINAFHYQSGPTDYDAVAKAVTEKGSEWGEPLMYSYENMLWQGYKPRSFPFKPGSDAIRHAWENARKNNSTLIQFTTWNDYHESSTLAPTTNIRYGLMDLNAYFVKWWKDGKPPKVDHDKIYLIYPKYRHELNAYPFGNRGPFTDTEAMNKLEVLTMLTAPATVRVTGTNVSWQAPAGLSYKQLPLVAGTTKVEVVRDGKITAKLDNSVDPVTDKPYRDGHAPTVMSTEDLRHWKADFGEESLAAMQRGEYGDIDNDGLPNWFEMYWFGKHYLDWESATKADPNADPDGDGLTNLQEYQARQNPTLEADYSPGFVWDLNQVTENSSAAFNPENDKFDTPVWYFMHKYSLESPVKHGGYWLCERFGWYPHLHRLKAVYAAPYSIPPSKPAGEFTRQWKKDGAKAVSGESMPLAPSRYQVTVRRYGLQALGWQSPITGKVRLEAKLSPLSHDKNKYGPAMLTVEHGNEGKTVFKKQFNPHEGVDIKTEPIDIKEGQMLFVVLDAAPGMSRQFTLDINKLTVKNIKFN